MIFTTGHNFWRDS